MANVQITRLIKKKRDKKPWTSEEIHFFIEHVVEGTVNESQIGASLMAIYLNGMNKEETRFLTDAMTYSGEVLWWPAEYSGSVVDKHSTGGVGDKLSLPLVPTLSACGLKVPMISGRGLYHTGGTLDKLESIPGYRVSLSTEEIRQCVHRSGGCIVGQTENLVPADKILYAVRDTTGTVESIPLIVGSMMSKKACERLDALVLEVTYGKAAPMKTIKEARTLANAMIETGKRMNIKTSAMLTRMDYPIGRLIGNSLEIRETVQCLNGQGPQELEDCVCQLGGRLLYMVGRCSSPEEGDIMIRSTIRDGTARERFKTMLRSQGVTAIDAEDLFHNVHIPILPTARYITQLKAESSGYVCGIDALTCGTVVQVMGGGRWKPTDKIDYAVGLEIVTPMGREIQKGQVWAIMYHNTDLPNEQLKELKEAITVRATPPPIEELAIFTEVLV